MATRNARSELLPVVAASRGSRRIKPGYSTRRFTAQLMRSRLVCWSTAALPLQTPIRPELARTRRGAGHRPARSHQLELEMSLIADQSMRVACISQTGACARPFGSIPWVNWNSTALAMICSALSGLRASIPS